jgi:hypothetical protein
MAEIFPASVIENWQLGAQQRLDPPLPTTVGFIAAVQARRRAVMYGCTGRAGRDGISCGAPRPLQRCEQ